MMWPFRYVRRLMRRAKFRDGEVLSRWIARDVRREIEVVSTDRIDEGLIVARVRTINVLYLAKGFVPEPDFGAAEELRIDEIWHWPGATWGGLPDGRSITGADPSDPLRRNRNE